jgi:fructose-bisphosphate aldolase class II
MLVPMKDLMLHAKEARYAVGSYDVPNLETAASVLQAAVDHESPVIIAFPEGFFTQQNVEVMVQAIRSLADPLDIPVALILDHGRSYNSCIRAIKAGMTTVMFDGSELPFDENMAITKAVVQAAHAVGVTVEAEVGHVAQPGASADLVAKALTDPQKALEFVQTTGIDCLAVAVGTIHGKYKGEPKIYFELLDELSKLINIPLVLHGGSSTGEENLQKAISLGICKINIYTDMSNAAKQNIIDLLAKDDPKTRINDIFIAAKKGFGDMAGHYMKVFGSAGNAKHFHRKGPLKLIPDQSVLSDTKLE